MASESLTRSARPWSTSSPSARATTHGIIIPTTSRRWTRSTMGNPPSFNNFATDPLFTGRQNKPRPAGLGPGSQYSIRPAFPNLTFGGGQEPNEVGFLSKLQLAQCPYTNWNDIYSFNDNISKVIGPAQPQGRTCTTRRPVKWNRIRKPRLIPGSLQLRQLHRDAEQHAGRIRQRLPRAISTVTARAAASVGNYWYSEIEAFVQDNWRVSRRVTLDFGMRFSHVVPTENLNDNSAAWLGSLILQPRPGERIYLSGLHSFHRRQGLPHGQPGRRRSQDRVYHISSLCRARWCRLPWAVTPQRPVPPRAWNG